MYLVKAAELADTITLRGREAKGDEMNYLDTAMFGLDVTYRFAKYQRTFRVHKGQTIAGRLCLVTLAFSMDDLIQMAEVAMEHGFLILNWAAIVNGNTQELIISLDLETRTEEGSVINNS